MNKELVREFLSKGNVFAVIGVSRDSEKYGYRVYRDLKDAGYRVYPVNPKADEIDGERCYHSLRELPELPDVVNIVVPPGVAGGVVRECEELGIKRVWLQPGSESQKAVGFCRENGIKVMHGICIMVERKG